jgi:hypothetical protein
MPDANELEAKLFPKKNVLGHRPYDSNKKTFGPYEWIDYQTLRQRRADFGVGIVELHKQIGATGSQYGVGLWCANRPEWQITGRLYEPPLEARLIEQILPACHNRSSPSQYMTPWALRAPSISSTTLL